MNNLPNRIFSFVSVVALSGLAFAPLASSQVRLSVGPQLSTLGVGVAATARVSNKIGISAEYNLFPLSETKKTGFDNTLTIEPTLGGGQAMLTFHPSGGKFALGAGLQVGGINGDLLIALDPNGSATLDLGTGSYPAAGVGNLTGTFEFGSVQPSFMLGWIGSGFNFAFGASIASPELVIEATGPLKTDAAFIADLQREIQDFDDSAGSVPVYPYLRIGWQFGGR
ncbi:MAG: hypothetical protein ACI80V_003595 [Rhodothermales bacterium]|jgi:hypothetical protein